MRELRSKDRNPEIARKTNYRLDRDIEFSPHAKNIEEALHKHLVQSSGKVRVLDKGAGNGNFSASLRKILGPELGKRLEITTISLTRSIAAENKSAINKERIGVGINMKHKQKFHVIIDFAGEDFRLSKDYLQTSIKKSILMLENGGDFFTIITLGKVKSAGPFTFAELDDFSNDLMMQGLIFSSQTGLLSDRAHAVIHFSTPE